MPSIQVTECSNWLAENNLTISFAESATAGRMCAEFALTPKSGKILIGGLVCYDAGVKTRVLKIDKQYIEKYTPESQEVTAEMAKALCDFLPADICVAVTGLTTPGGSESPEKPVGTMFVNVIYKDKSSFFREVFEGSDEEIMIAAINRTAEVVRRLTN